MSSAPSATGIERQRGLTPRSLLLGLAMVALVCRWIHQAELVVGQRGHSALANTSIPLGAFGGLLLVLAGNALIRRLLPRWALARGEVLVVYVMMTCATVVASSGGIHFLVPVMLAPFHFATAENHLDLVVPYIPKWFAPQSPQAIADFYQGNAPVPYQAWLVPGLAWTIFLLAFLGLTVNLSVLLRRQWVDRERLTFPTVVLPLELTRSDGALLRNPVLWGGFAVAFLLGLINNLHANLPAVPDLNVRVMPIDAAFSSKFAQAMRPVSVSFYPFVIGIGYLLSLDVTLSCWLFLWIGKLQAGLAAQLGHSDIGTGLGRFPYLQEQGAGAFLALTAFSLWFARGTIREMLQTAFTRRRPLDDSQEPLSYRTAFLGAGGCLLVLLAFCAQAGLAVGLAAVVFALSLAVLVAATRIRAETGNAWLFGPMMDPHRLILAATNGRLGLRDLTIMAFLRSLSNFDMRCQSMPHQLDAFKMADVAQIRPRQVSVAIIVALAFAIPVALVLALQVWYAQGALGRAEPWRTTMGRTIFEEIVSVVLNPPRSAAAQLGFVGVGFVATILLTVVRATWVSCPLHPIGYAMAGTNTMNSIWMPFFLAWLIKSVTLRVGGMKAYRRAIPFFLGLILGDFLCGAGATLLACFLPQLKIYPINW
ncbi:MAG: hypothetical protein IT204_17340 [Fimbriimonadaceae bacterium]|nr:hypothetical protein [Fimbriimonadaceae bacterium]